MHDILCDLSVSRNFFSKAEMRQFYAEGTEGLYNRMSTRLDNLKSELVW